MVFTDTQLQLQPATAPNNTHPVLSGKVGCVSTKHGQETLATWQRARWRPIPHWFFAFSKQHCSETAQFISIYLNFPTERKALKNAFKLQWTQLRPFAQQQIGGARHARSEGWQQTHHRWPPESVTVWEQFGFCILYDTITLSAMCNKGTTIVPNYLQCFGESTNCKSQPVSNPNQLCGRSPSLCAFAHLNGHAIWWDTDPNGLGAASWVLTWRSEKSGRDCAPGLIHLRSWHCYLDQQSKVQHPLGQDSP